VTSWHNLSVTRRPLSLCGTHDIRYRSGVITNDGTIGVGLAGFGTVGSGVWNALAQNGGLITERAGSGVQFEIRQIIVRDTDKPREATAPAELFTTDWKSMVENPLVDIVIELIGGTEEAFELVAASLGAGKPVVTGNKALLAERGEEVFALACRHQTPVYFEAAVAGGIPIIKAVRESFVGNQIDLISGIINGTSNYILMRMTEAGLDYPSALNEAKELGYAEADETLDVNGWDAAHKAMLLATIVHGFVIDPEEVYVRGIEYVRPLDIRFAKELGYVVKLLCIVRKHEDGSIEIRTQPSFIPKTNILASVNDVFNAVAIRGDGVGDALFYGRGAGQDPTASSVVSDLVDAGRALRCASKGERQGFLPYRQKGTLKPVDETETAYYVRFPVTDRPGVVADIASILARAGIGISGTHSSIDPDEPDAAFVDMVFLLHTCPFGILKSALKGIEDLDCVTERPVVFRIETLQE